MSQSGRDALPVGSDEATLGGFGCPMLVRGHALVRAGQRPLVRCSFGWSLHTERELERCIATDTSERCWKAREDHGAVHEAAFVASQAPRRRAASASSGQGAATDDVVDTTGPDVRPLRAAASRHQAGTADRPFEDSDPARPVFVRSEGAAADH